MGKERQKTTIEILQEIRQSRNDFLKSKDDNSISVVKVEVLGKGKQTQKEIYRLVEEKNVENPETGEFETEISELFYEYDNGPKIIAMRNFKTNGEIVPNGIDGDENKDWDILKEEIEQCLEEREKQLKAIAKELGIDPEDIESLSEIELEQKVDEKAIEREEQEEKDEDEPQEISEQEAKRVGITGLSEVKTNTEIDTKGTNLRKAFKLGRDVVSIYIVHSYKLGDLKDENGKSGNIHKAPLALVAKMSDGTFRTMPEFELYTGEKNRVLETDNKEDVEVRKEECIFNVKGSDYSFIVNREDTMGTPKAYVGKKAHNGQGTLATRVQDNRKGTEKQEIKVRQLMDSNRGYRQPDRSLEEVDEHLEAGCKDLGFEEADGDKNTGHLDFNPESPEQQKAIEEIMRRGGRDTSRECAEAKLAEALQDTKEDISLDDAVNIAVQSIERDYIGDDGRQRQ